MGTFLVLFAFPGEASRTKRLWKDAISPIFPGSIKQ